MCFLSNKLSSCRCFALFVFTPIDHRVFVFFLLMECSRQTEKHGKKLLSNHFWSGAEWNNASVSSYHFVKRAFSGFVCATSACS